MENSTGKEKNVKKPNRCFEIYLEYVQMYNVLKLDWTVQRSYPVQIKNIWQDMAKKLNACGGPVRDVTHWKKVFTEWKSHTRRKLKCEKPLNDMEKHLVEITGLTSIPEKTSATDKIAKRKSKKIEKRSENIPVIKQEEVDSDDSEDEITTSVQGIERSKDEILPKSLEVVKEKSNKGMENDNIFKQLIPTASPLNKSKSNTGSANRQSLDIATQVDQSMLVNGNESASIGTGLVTLAKAVNRYCDILERRIF